MVISGSFEYPYTAASQLADILTKGQYRDFPQLQVCVDGILGSMIQPDSYRIFVFKWGWTVATDIKSSHVGA